MRGWLVIIGIFLLGAFIGTKFPSANVIGRVVDKAE